MRPAHAAALAKLRFRSASRSHPGRKRTVNEDRILVSSEAGLWAVADGMGGLSGGDVAAARVIEAIAAADDGFSGYARLSDILRRLDNLNGALFGEARAGRSSGSTFVALLAQEDHCACLWAGDSRAYRLRAEAFTRLSHDHSLVQELVDGGELTETERRRHPASHIITRAVGADLRLNVDQRFAAIEEGDIFLLCSDGLTGCLEDAELADALKTPDLDKAAGDLLDRALARNAPDNVSVIIVRAEV